MELKRHPVSGCEDRLLVTKIVISPKRAISGKIWANFADDLAHLPVRPVMV